MPTFLRAAIALMVLFAASGLSGDSSTVRAEEEPVRLSLLSVAAWAGEVEPLDVEGVRVGGAAELASRVVNQRAANPNTLVLGTGNSFGTSPPLANLFQDEPVIKAMNAIGFDADALGNDNFDHGTAYLQRLLTMADFPFLAANLANLNGNLSGVKPYQLFEVDGVSVAIIGVTDPASAGLVFPGYFGTIEITDPVFAAAQAREAAKNAGAEVFVLITEMGVLGTEPATGSLLDLAGRVQGFDVILGNGGSRDFTATINGARVVAPQSRGLSLGHVELQIRNGAVESVEAGFILPKVTGEKSGLAVNQLILSYREGLNSRLSAVIAESSVEMGFTDACGLTQARECESLTGNVVTDALRSAYGTDIAVLNSGGLRSGLTCSGLASEFCPAFSGPPFPITEGQIQAVLPFANLAAVATVSGTQLKAMLENSVLTVTDDSGRFLQVSGFCFWYDISAPAGSRVLAAVLNGDDGECSGAAIGFDDSTSLQLVTNDFLAAGGDNYPVLDDAVLRERIDTVLSRELQAQGLVSPAIEGRITCVGGGCPALLTGAARPLPSGSTSGTIRPPATGSAGLR